MKKKIWIPIIVSVVLLAVLFVPIPNGQMKDGGTRVYSALTYKIVDWNRLYNDEMYSETKVYFGADAWKSIDDLFAEEEPNIESVVRATIIEINGSSVLIEPLEGEWERMSGDRISINVSKLEDIGAEVGSVVEVTYKGNIMESYPAKINAIGWKMSATLRHLEYTGEWLDKTTAEKYDTNVFSDIIITEIYSNCFFAETVIPMPYTIKLNGTLSEDWCVGDQIRCTYTNTYYDAENNRVECDFSSVEASDWEPEPGVDYKPVIYLYPEEKTEVSVTLDYNGKLICTYPSYDNGWTVTANPDGTLIDANGQTYNYLYWEGETNAQYDLSKGFCVKGEDTAEFLEYALAELGLTRREANEFIVFWLPMMQNNEYNIISFQGIAYTDSAKLNIDPAPDTLIRVFMAWQASEIYVNIPEQELNAPAREGFTVVEWGGTEIK